MAGRAEGIQISVNEASKTYPRTGWSMLRLARTARLVLGYGKDVAVRIFKPCDFARRTLLDAERVLLHVRISLEDDAAFGQKSYYFLDILHFLVVEGQSQHLLVELPCSLRVRDTKKSVEWVGGQHFSLQAVRP